MHLYFCNYLKKFTCKLGLLLTISVLFACGVAAQQRPSQSVSGLIGAPFAELTYGRPRRVTASSNPIHPFSLEQATSIERIAFELTNDERLANGLPPLAWDSDLCRLAREHSHAMGGRGFFDHETPEGLLPKDRARAAGVRGFRVIAENIAYNKGYENPGAFAVERWMRSSGHRANILYSPFQYSAIGSYVASDGSVYLTQVFISR